MATRPRSQVLSMFGITTPEQVLQEELERQQSFLNSQQSGFGRSGAALGIGLARLFGGKSEQLTRAEQLQERFKSVDPNNPEALREAARGIADLAPEQALQIASYANELEKTMQPKVEYRDVTVAYTQRPVINRLTGLPTGEFEEVPIKDTAIIQNGVITGYTSGRGMNNQKPLGQLNISSEEAAAIVNAETANMDYRQTDRDASGTIVGVTPQQEVAQPTLQITTEGTGTPVAPTAPITATPVTRPRVGAGQGNRQGTPTPSTKPSVTAEDPLKKELAAINSRLVARRKNPLTTDEKAALIAAS
jgi:hypothetical protein